MTHWMSPDQWATLCEHAFENLPQDTPVVFDDVDAILTWCIPEYERLRDIREDCVSCAKGRRDDCGHIA